MHQVVGCRLRRGVGVGGQGESAAAEDFQSEVSAAFCPFIGLLGQDRADEPDEAYRSFRVGFSWTFRCVGRGKLKRPPQASLFIWLKRVR